MAKDDKKELTGEDYAAAAAAVKPEHPEWEPPEQLGNDFHEHRLALRFWFKKMEEPFAVKGIKGEPGDYVGRSSDGSLMHLTEAELQEHYKLV